MLRDTKNIEKILSSRKKNIDSIFTLVDFQNLPKFKNLINVMHQTLWGVRQYLNFALIII